MPSMPLKNDVFSRCSSHATRCQYHCCWPKTASWKFEACWFLACAACRKRTTFSTFRSNTESLLLGSKEELKGTHSTTGTNWIYQSLSPTDAKGLQLSWLQWFGIWIIDLSVRKTSRKGLQRWKRPYTTISHRMPVLQSYFQIAMSKEGMQELPSYRKIRKSEIWIWTSLNPALNTLVKGLQLWPCQEGDVLTSCAILLRLASCLLRDLEIRKAFSHLQYPNKPVTFYNGYSGILLPHHTHQHQPSHD